MTTYQKASDMKTIIDWLSFTVHIGEHEDNDWFYSQIDKTCQAFLGKTWDKITDNLGDWQIRSGRAPYSTSYDTMMGIKIYFGKPEHVLIECSGTGCAWLNEIGALNDTQRRIEKAVTRVDVAVDMVSTATPTQFTEQRQGKRFRATSTIKSSSGETIYLGSRKSEKYARVYRYAEPHPRANLLRAEHVFRKDAAKRLLHDLNNSTLQDITASIGEMYGWLHADWQPDGEPIELSTYRAERPEGKTIAWLISQCGPAFRKCVDSGAIENPEGFLREYFLQ